MTFNYNFVSLIYLMATIVTLGAAFSFGPHTTPPRRPLSTALFAATVQKGYEPKWKKKQTLAEQFGGVKNLKEIGLKGDIPVVFRQGNETKTTVALAGQPLRDVASQAGQFIKYGCGKGECGTCEALVNGQWIRPCISLVPAFVEGGGDYVVMVKEIKAKDQGSGKFYSIKSFLKGFYNNFLGMVGLVKYRRAARANWEERQEYEDLVKQKTLERKLARKSEISISNGKLAP